jgi:surfeit locus 1 family protein
MKMGQGRGPLSNLAVPALFAFALFVAFIGLGTWQIERKAWKEALIAKLAERSAAEPVDLPSSRHWSALDQAEEEFRRVRLKAEFLPGREAFVYTTAPESRLDGRMPGYWVFAPARTLGGVVVVVNRGFTPEQREHQAHGTPSGVIEIVGTLRWPEPAGWFVREYDGDADMWFARNHLGMAARNNWGHVAPFYIELETPQPPGGLPRPGVRRANLRNVHLQYAITWYALAVVVVVMFGLWLGGRRKAARPA